MATQTALFNPNNGQPLYVGQTATFNGITYTGTTPLPSSSSSKNTAPTVSSAPSNSSSGSGQLSASELAQQAANYPNSYIDPTTQLIFPKNMSQQDYASLSSANQAIYAKLAQAAGDTAYLGTSSGSSGNQTAAFNPNNGQPLYVGQTATFNGITYTGTTPQPSSQSQNNSTSSSSSNSGSTVTQGQPGPDGNIVLYNPVTGAKLNPGETVSTSSGQDATPTVPPLPSTGDPAMDKAQNETAAAITQLYNTGAIPASLELTPANVAQILQIAQNQTSPQTQQYIQNEVANVNANIQNLGNQFSNSEAQTIQDFGANLATEQNTAGASGTAFSGQRAINETNLADSTNRTLAGLSSQVTSDVGSALRTGAAQVGTSNANQFTIPNLTSSSVGITGGQRGNVDPGTAIGYNYDPSQYTVGSIPTTQATTAQNLANTYTQQYGTLASNPANSGRSVSDLLSTIPGLSGNTF